MTGKFEQIAEKPSRGLGDDHRVRLGEALQARREVRRLPDNAALLRLSEVRVFAGDQALQRRGDTLRFC